MSIDFIGRLLARSLPLSIVVPIIGNPFSLVTNHQTKVDCADFQQTIRATYNFRPALLASDEERHVKSAAMDKFWDAVKADTRSLLPCLRKALDDPEADPWFLFDGSNLLVSLDPSADSKTTQIRNYAKTNLDIPLVRKVRRQIIAASNQHAIEFYDSFTRILMTMVLKSSPTVKSTR